MIKVIDNFLHQNDFNKLKDIAFKSDFYYAPFVSSKNATDVYYFERNIFSKCRIMSPIFSFIERLHSRTTLSTILMVVILLFSKVIF